MSKKWIYYAGAVRGVGEGGFFVRLVWSVERGL